MLAPPRFPTSMVNRTQNINSELAVECGAYATPVPEYQWMFNGSIITRRRSLNLSSLTLSDQGFYTCVANNSFGSVSGKFYLTIQGKSLYINFLFCILVLASSKEKQHFINYDTIMFHCFYFHFIKQNIK